MPVNLGNLGTSELGASPRKLAWQSLTAKAAGRGAMAPPSSSMSMEGGYLHREPEGGKGLTWDHRLAAQCRWKGGACTMMGGGGMHM